MHISQRGLSLVENFEGFSAYPYDDGTGTMTIGYGTTSADVDPLPGHLSQSQAQALLQRKLAEKYEPAVNSLDVPLNSCQFDALCSFVYNLGPGAMQWDVGRYLQAREYHAAADALLQYDHAGGQRLPGLTRRREAERALFLTPDGPPPPPPDPYHYDRFDTTWRDVGEGRRAQERRTVQEYDDKRRHPHRYPIRLRRLRDNLSVLAARLETVLDEQPGTEGQNHRRWREKGLSGRALGRRYV